jgi:hypothetical protein
MPAPPALDTMLDTIRKVNCTATWGYSIANRLEEWSGSEPAEAGSGVTAAAVDKPEDEQIQANQGTCSLRKAKYVPNRTVLFRAG